MENKKDSNETDFSTDLEPELKQEQKPELNPNPKQKQDLHEFNNLLKKLETSNEKIILASDYPKAGWNA